MDGQVEGRLTLNFKVIRQGHVIYPNIFEFYNLNYVKNNTNLIALLHLRQKISWFTNNGKTVHFDHRHGHLTSWHMSLDSVKMMSHMSKCVFYP